MKAKEFTRPHTQYTLYAYSRYTCTLKRKYFLTREEKPFCTDCQSRINTVY